MMLIREVIHLDDHETLIFGNHKVNSLDLVTCEFDFENVRIKKNTFIGALVSRYGAGSKNCPIDLEETSDGRAAFSDEFSVNLMGPFLVMGGIIVNISGKSAKFTYMTLIEE
jgi:hypothetical protein